MTDIYAYCSTFCNHAHRMSDGKPIKHECRVIPPKVLHLERAGQFEEAIALLQSTRVVTHRGVREEIPEYAGEAELTTIAARAYNDVAREMQLHGVRLTYEQADALGQDALDWLHHRLGLTVRETDACVECVAVSS